MEFIFMLVSFSRRQNTPPYLVGITLNFAPHIRKDLKKVVYGSVRNQIENNYVVKT